MKLILADHYLTSKNPSLKAWLQAFDVTRDLFEEIEIWSSQCEIPLGKGISWVKIPQIFPQWTLHSIDFQRQVTRRLAAHPPKNHEIVLTTGTLLPVADIRYIHFWNSALLEEHQQRKSTFPLPFLKQVPARVTAHRETHTIQSARANDAWWVVSRSLAQKIQSQGAQGSFHVLPNQYDTGRFNRGVRAEWRTPMRSHYGFEEKEFILAFSSMGHFERKGLRQAVEAVDLLRKRGHSVRLLVLGGLSKTIEAFRRSLTEDQRRACVFAGMVDSIERHLVAADGFLFPSHFEAFSLAEIEAAALGLRLYLTPHYGSEMILREPENGRLLPWDSAGMADVMERDIHELLMGQPHHQLGEALDSEQFADELRRLYLLSIEAKKGSRSA